METMQQTEYLLQLQIKEERIKSLEDEIKNLKFTLSFKENEYCTRENELLQELGRYAEQVEKLQSQIRTHETNKRRKSDLQNKPKIINNQQQTLNQRINATTHDYPDLFSSKNIDADTICMALQNFIDKNKQQCGSSSNRAQESHMLRLKQSFCIGSSEEEQLVTRIAKIIAENPMLFFRMQNDLNNSLNNFNEPLLNNSASIMSLFSDNFLLSSFQESVEYDVPKECPDEQTEHHTDFDEIIQSVIDKAYSDSDTQSVSPLGSSFNVKSSGGCSSSTNKKNALKHAQFPKPISEEEQRLVKEMQKQIAENIEKLGARALNTMEVALQCKRLMTSYNIGQRLFAKYVMCQVSQGSLSELLSKPRPWKKLTDKGREAFRRIYGWLSDDNAIELLCLISPRRMAITTEKVEHPDPESLFEFEDQLADESGTLMVWSTFVEVEVFIFKHSHDK